MEDLAEMVLSEAGGRYEIHDPPPDQISHKNYVTTKLRETIDWQPTIRLREGIKRTTDAQREALCLATA